MSMTRSEFMGQMQRLFKEFPNNYSDTKIDLLFQNLREYSLHDLVVVVDSVIYDCKTLPVPYEIQKRMRELPRDATVKCEYCDDTGVRSVSLRGNPNVKSTNPILNTRVICACPKGQGINDFDTDLFAFKEQPARWSDDQRQQYDILKKLRLRAKARLLDPTTFAPANDHAEFFNNVVLKLIKSSGALSDDDFNNLILARKNLVSGNVANNSNRNIGNFKIFDQSVSEKIFGEFL